MCPASSGDHHVAMTAALTARKAQIWRTTAWRSPISVLDLVCWTIFASAAVVFVLDAMTTIHVLSVQPLALEQNPIARWTLDAHPIAPFVLKAAVVGECAVVVATVRSMGEGWAAYVVSGLMAATGLLGITSALAAFGA